MRRLAAAALLALAAPLPAEFVNWETPAVHPLALSDDGATLAAVNLPDGYLEVFSVSPGGIALRHSVPVGVDPVSVRFRTATEAWVVNQISDSISVVDTAAGRVVATIQTGDEPADVVFAGDPVRAFVTCSQVNRVQVFDPVARTRTAELEIEGESPRALAASPDGRTVYAAIYESGNRTTIIGGNLVDTANLAFPPNVVNNPAGPHGGVNPPPNNGTAWMPPRNEAAGTPPRVSLIVRRGTDGAWRDDTGADWTSMVSGENAAASGRVPGWDLVDHDLAAIDTETLGVRYATGLHNICMGVAVNPATDEVAVIGTDGTNVLRFEPLVNGTFLRVALATVDPETLGRRVADLNNHLSYQSKLVLPPEERARSLGDPRAIVFNSFGTRAFVAGMGSNNVIEIDASGERQGDPIPVGEGPMGLALDEDRDRLYVLNRFANSVSIVNLATSTESARVPLHDPSPQAIKRGRKHLYDTHRNSGLGYVACASCHVDARTDRLSWDLGDPAGQPITPNIATHNMGMNIPILGGGSTPFHPMKGPMVTQTLQDIIGHEPLHWRGDRLGLEEFNHAFTTLQSAERELTPGEMQEFEDFLATIAFPPNPYRNVDNTLPTDVPLARHYTTGRFGPAGEPLPNGNAQAGLDLYLSPLRLIDRGFVNCATCHTLPTGMGSDHYLINNQLIPRPVGPMGEHHAALVTIDGVTNVAMKIPHLRSLYRKVGFNTTQTRNTAGFGLLHDGSVDSIERFLSEPAFSVQSDQEVADLTAFMLAFTGSDLPQGSPTNFNNPPGMPSLDTHAAVGRQAVLEGAAGDPLATQLVSLATPAAARIDVVAKGRGRGWAYDRATQTFLPDQRGEPGIALAALAATASSADPIVVTAVPRGTGIRIGIDRDSDGYLDREEISNSSDPADPASIPVPDADRDGFSDAVEGAYGGDPKNPEVRPDFGDADSSGATTLIDALVLARSAPAYDSSLDIDEDGDLDDTDAHLLLLWAMGVVRVIPSR